MFKKSGGVTGTAARLRHALWMQAGDVAVQKPEQDAQHTAIPSVLLLGRGDVRELGRIHHGRAGRRPLSAGQTTAVKYNRVKPKIRRANRL